VLRLIADGDDSEDDPQHICDKSDDRVTKFDIRSAFLRAIMDASTLEVALEITQNWEVD
jgi:hypothetical protein